MTVGYGDIVPVNAREATIVSFCELIGGIAYVYNINAIGQVLGEIKQEREELRKQMLIMRKFF